MANKIYVGNMSYNTTEEDLRVLFAAYGDVTSVSVVTDKYTGQPRGFAFVEMSTPDAASDAIAGLNGKEVAGRTLKIDVARDRKDRRDF